MSNINKGKSYWGFKHEKAIEMLNADRFVNEFCIKDMDGNYINHPVAVYYSKNPDLSKGHKQYPYLQIVNGTLYVGALDAEEIEEYRYQVGIKCSKCEDVIYSTHRHDYRLCECKECFVDGGRDYLRCGGGELVKIDLIENTWNYYEKK